MKKLINDPENVVREELSGIARAHADRVEVHVDPARVRPVDQPLLVADPSKLRAATGWEPEFSIERTLADMLHYWRDELARLRGAHR